MLAVEWVWVVTAGYRIDVGCGFWVRVGVVCVMGALIFKEGVEVNVLFLNGLQCSEDPLTPQAHLCC